MWENQRRCNVHVMAIPEEEGRGTEKTFKR